jgi:hypothetical protein
MAPLFLHRALKRWPVLVLPIKSRLFARRSRLERVRECAFIDCFARKGLLTWKSSSLAKFSRCTAMYVLHWVGSSVADGETGA